METNKVVRTAFVVDDSPEVLAAVIAHINATEGWLAWGVTDPRQAVAYCRSVRFDLLLTDFGMPHMSGKELADRIASDEEIPFWAGPKCVAMMTASETTLSAFGPNVHAILHKPFSGEAVMALLTSCEVEEKVNVARA